MHEEFMKMLMEMLQRRHGQQLQGGMQQPPTGGFMDQPNYALILQDLRRRMLEESIQRGGPRTDIPSQKYSTGSEGSWNRQMPNEKDPYNNGPIWMNGIRG